MKTYLVTGIARGLGKAVAELLLSQGHQVYGTYNSHKDAAESLQSTHKNLKIFAYNALDDKSRAALIEAVKEVHFDGIVNSAGVFLEIDFANFDKAAFEDTFKINVFAPFYLVQALRGNIKKSGAVVNVASNDAMVGAVLGVAYSASKAALLSVTQSLANILADQKIRVNAVAPGWMGEGMEAPEELLKIAADYNPLKRIASYKEVAEVIVFLLSDKASYVNGATLTVDGGDMATNYVLQKEAEIAGV